jgi:DNA-binding GntR family transcriptional regulator
MTATEPRHLAAYRALLDAITAWELRPGQPIPEVEYANRLGVSRTPVREALRTLTDQGLVRIVPGRGAFVAELSVADMREIYEMREALECYAGRLAATKGVAPALLDELEAEILEGHAAIENGDIQRVFDAGVRLDRAIAEAADNQRLGYALEILRVQAARIRRMAALSTERLHYAVNEHLELVAALRDRDPDRVASITRRHIAGSAESKVGELGLARSADRYSAP